MTITRWLRQKVEEEQLEEVRAEGMAKGMHEGSARTHSAWLEWYNRSQEARKKGEPFDEPPPEL